MKKVLFSLFIILITVIAYGQKYPEPEFSNEISYLKKDSVNSIVRLEKGSSKMDTKTKMGGFGGSESGYEMEGEKSTVRLNSGHNLSFVLMALPGGLLHHLA
jgi:uncharacterized protein YxeA